MRCRWCVGFACEVDAKCGTQNTVIPQAIETGNCELRTRVHREGDSHRRSRPRHRRRLLRFRRTPAGANRRSRDCLLRRHRVGAPAAEFQEPSFPQRPGQSLRLGRTKPAGPRLHRRRRLVRARNLRRPRPRRFHRDLRLQPRQPGLRRRRNAGQRIYSPALSVCVPQRPGKSRAGARPTKTSCARYYRRSISVMGPMQEMPVFESRVQVDPKVKDYWGIPVVASLRASPRKRLLGTKFLSAKAELWLKEAGATTTIPFGAVSREGPSGGQHQAGTCRMGNDPKTSVVDKFCRVHDVDNFYVIDGSVHVTNGGFNPVLTIMAIAYYASTNLLKSWKGTHARAWPKSPSVSHGCDHSGGGRVCRSCFSPAPASTTATPAENPAPVPRDLAALPRLA